MEFLFFWVLILVKYPYKETNTKKVFFWGGGCGLAAWA